MSLIGCVATEQNTCKIHTTPRCLFRPGYISLRIARAPGSSPFPFLLLPPSFSFSIHSRVDSRLHSFLLFDRATANSPGGSHALVRPSSSTFNGLFILTIVLNHGFLQACPRRCRPTLRLCVCVAPPRQRHWPRSRSFRARRYHLV